MPRNPEHQDMIYRGHDGKVWVYRTLEPCVRRYEDPGVPADPDD